MMTRRSRHDNSGNAAEENVLDLFKRHRCTLHFMFLVLDHSQVQLCLPIGPRGGISCRPAIEVVLNWPATAALKLGTECAKAIELCDVSHGHAEPCATL